MKHFLKKILEIVNFKLQAR